MPVAAAAAAAAPLSSTNPLTIFPNQVVSGQIDMHGGAFSHLDPIVLIATGGSILSNYTWSITTGFGVPQPSIFLKPLTGVVQANSTSLIGGLYTMHVTVTDDVGTSVNGIVTVDLNAICDSSVAVSCSTAGLNDFHINYLPNAKVGNTYSASLLASGGTPPYMSWSLFAGALPLGFHIDSASGALIGTPTIAGIYNFYVQVNDNAGGSTMPRELGIFAAQYTLVVDP